MVTTKFQADLSLHKNGQSEYKYKEAAMLHPHHNILKELELFTSRVVFMYTGQQVLPT